MQYNSTPEDMIALLNTLAVISTNDRKINSYLRMAMRRAEMVRDGGRVKKKS